MYTNLVKIPNIFLFYDLPSNAIDRHIDGQQKFAPLKGLLEAQETFLGIFGI